MLQKNFPGSLRVKGLEGMLHEARSVVNIQNAANPVAAQNVDRSTREANRCYNEMLKEDPCNAFARKRKVRKLFLKSVASSQIPGLNFVLSLQAGLYVEDNRLSRSIFRGNQDA